MKISKYLQESYDDESKWYDFCSGVRVKIKLLTPLQRNVLMSNHSKRTRRSVGAEVNWEAYSRALHVASVVDWEGFNDENDKPVPLSPETLLKLIDHWNAFKDFLDDILVLGRGESGEESEKNS